ncbi:MAG: hypothetical protein HOG95_02110 [Rhodospirillaceae bacterium]|nr:hypothetical protein [Rhodospirillaceae bacterium]MBT5938692.1 hypothetical protein [Rhodospirillaceae bacterium]MBT7268636.1 hypothetical protein [Rhodospirillaceae bacterium]
MDVIPNFIENHPLLAMIGMTAIVVILRLFGIGKKMITWGAIVLMAGGSVYLAKTMG